MEQQQDESTRKIMSGPKAAEIASAQTIEFDPGVFDAVLSRVSGTASGGDLHRSLRRRLVSIVIEPDLCRPDTFAKAFKLEMVELDSEQELRALAKLGKFSVPPQAEEDGDEEMPDGEDAAGAGQALAMTLAREAIHSVNGRKLAGHEKALLWEIMGFGGRLAAGMAFIAHGTGLDPDLLGKSVASVEIG